HHRDTPSFPTRRSSDLGLAKDDSIRAVVYRGAGTVAFAAGADISEFQDNRKDSASALEYNKHTDAAYTAIRTCPKPTVAMIHGLDRKSTRLNSSHVSIS